ncbi:ABC transporter permease [Dissulfurirhabdus thermomarina]|uniref:ABC transporter permease n=1 Tax=Dissulfurirhabdus thermomarina TaxID=1765737 RepID=A0A6N9TNJ2_DISTH|nr:FtsX-like permease family protein [Dissulfurirhabdus thermomarina]NDY42618.1 ABC transporter permease [Dissulfurirhabdus thermomarina]NMX24075.1 ABC transporter permease [Dissulfurirhabdus thermomarina]
MRPRRLAFLALLGWRNLWRRPGRTAVLLAAVAAGSWTMVVSAAFMRGAIDQVVEETIRNLTGHVQVHAPGYRDDPVVDHRMPPPSPALRRALDAPGVRAWAPRVRVPAVVASERESAGVVLVGIDPAAERGLSFIPGAVVRGRGLEGPGDPGILLGRRLARHLETRVGKRVVVMSQDAANVIASRGFRVVGVFGARLEATEKAFAFTGIETAQRMLGIGGDISEIALAVTDRGRIAPVLRRLRAAAPDLDVQPWNVLEPILGLRVAFSQRFSVIWYLIVFLAMAFGLVNTLLMAVFERTREFGLFRALGMRPGAVVAQVLLEAFFLLALGLAAGNLAAVLTVAASGEGIDVSAFARGAALAGLGHVIPLEWTAGDALAANLLVIVLGMAAALYPAWRAARTLPVESIARASA